jgi:hypothetical protein
VAVLLTTRLVVQVSGNGTATGTQNVEPSLVNYDAAASRLSISGLNHTLACAEDVLFSWSG